MDEPRILSDDDIDGLVRRHLDRAGDRIDPRPGLDRLRADLGWSGPECGEPAGGGHRWLGRRVWAWGLSAAAAALVLSSFVLLQTQPALARAETLVREAKKAHLLPLDRCYLVEVRRDSDLFDECAPLTSQVRQTRLWTRGDRFWVESVHPERRWAWGRDERNRFWIALGPHRGIRLEPDEVSEWLNLCCDLYCIRVEQLLGQMLRDFDLKRETSATTSGTIPATQVVRATPKASRDHPNIKSLVIELDAETRVVRKLVLERTRMGQPFATVTYTLAETGTLDNDTFQLEGHLVEPYYVFTQDFQPRRRRELLAFCFGSKASALFRLKGEN